MRLSGSYPVPWKKLALAVPPTLTVLVVLALLERLSLQRVLFASLASSAFLIYRDPNHQMNSARTMLLAHITAVLVSLIVDVVFGPGYLAGGCAMIITTMLLIVFDAIHPPAISTTLSFAFRTEEQRTIILFGVALFLMFVLVVLQRLVVWMVRRFERR